ncbi:hypothetical protein [Phaeodactylibacter luteus]|uniref:Ig-like domain-containing protein n=1 Tax=Phaeodactylibacter luteus TaxID=1564516 RepID=A0A5C6RW74_9BACT|nr:hypothetical protein [Phaeodactylibacter luteus]TXB66347.1 hypothetical protein FRY97_05915 [Phaeodactylibacter luteus]
MLFFLLFPLLASLAAPADQPTDCSFHRLELGQFGPCNDNGTLDWKDDTFTASLTLGYTSRPAQGFLLISSRQLMDTLAIPVGQLPASAERYTLEKVAFQAGQQRQRISLKAWFSDAPDCARSNPDAGKSREQCSVCAGPPGTTGQRYPECWPVQATAQPCTQSVNYAPDPDYPELTPLRYMQVIVHIFQKEDPDQLGQWAPHPTDPANFTEAHLPIIRSWFDDPKGVNGLLSNLCDDPTDASPHMTDARVRLLNTGTPGKDVFFHPDNRGWGIGYSGCKPGGYSYWYKVADRYIENPSPQHPDYEALSAPQTQNAFHVFVTAGKWQAEPPGDPRIPDDNDCYWPCGGGLTSSMGCVDGQVPDHPAQAMFGTYNIWLHGNTPGEQACEIDYPGSDAGLGENLLGEIFHVLSLDHLSPLQAHKRHPDGGDGCSDTPWKSDYNRLGCNIPGRCALSQCQIGRMLHFFSELKPSFERFPDGQGGFSAFPSPCAPTQPPLVVPEGADITWSAPQELRSGLVISAGARLTIDCKLGMPAGAGITVKPGGELVLNGGQIYSRCKERPWAGLSCQGRFQASGGAVIEYAEKLLLLPGGQAEVNDALFFKCSNTPASWCGQDGNICID